MSRRALPASGTGSTRGYRLSCTALREMLRLQAMRVRHLLGRLAGRLPGGYRPERHYMRGPGPAAAKGCRSD